MRTRSIASHIAELSGVEFPCCASKCPQLFTDGFLSCCIPSRSPRIYTTEETNIAECTSLSLNSLRSIWLMLISARSANRTIAGVIFGKLFDPSILFSRCVFCCSAGCFRFSVLECVPPRACHSERGQRAKNPQPQQTAAALISHQVERSGAKRNEVETFFKDSVEICRPQPPLILWKLRV